jgi:2-methylcitrate dehydratase PrpD
MPYAVGAALHDGHVRLSSFTDAAVQRPEMQRFFVRVEARDETTGPALPRWGRVRIELKDGRVLEKTVTGLRGAAGNPLSDAELVDKAKDCFVFGGYTEASAQAFADAAFAIGERPASELIAHCMNVPGAGQAGG